MAGRTFTESRSLTFIEKLLVTMGRRKWSVAELAQVMCTHPYNLRAYLRHLASGERRSIYIAGYRKGKLSKPARLYSVGNKPDAAYPGTTEQGA